MTILRWHSELPSLVQAVGSTPGPYFAVPTSATRRTGTLLISCQVTQATTSCTMSITLSKLICSAHNDIRGLAFLKKTWKIFPLPLQLQLGLKTSLVSLRMGRPAFCLVFAIIPDYVPHPHLPALRDSVRCMHLVLI